MPTFYLLHVLAREERLCVRRSGAARGLSLSPVLTRPPARRSFCSRNGLLLPDLPTLIKADMEGCEGHPWFGLIAPPATPKAIDEKLNAELTAVLNNDSVQLLALGRGRKQARLGNSAGTLVDMDASLIREFGNDRCICINDSHAEMLGEDVAATGFSPFAITVRCLVVCSLRRLQRFGFP